MDKILEYYVYGSGMFRTDSLNEAIEKLKNTTGSYVAIGIEYQNGACDVIVKENGAYRISLDWEQSKKSEVVKNAIRFMIATGKSIFKIK